MYVSVRIGMRTHTHSVHCSTDGLSHRRALCVHIHTHHTATTWMKRLFGVRTVSQTVSNHTYIHHVCVRVLQWTRSLTHNDRMNTTKTKTTTIVQWNFSFLFQKKPKHQYTDAMQSGYLAGLKWSIIRTISARIGIELEVFFRYR